MTILTGVRLYFIVVLISFSLKMRDFEHLFMCLLSICLPSLEKCPFRSSDHFVIRLFICWYWAAWVACIFWRLIILSAFSFAILFCHSKGCLFTLLVVSFIVQKHLNLIKSHLFIFVFISITLGGGSLRILLWFMSECVLPMFSSTNFMVFGLKFRSLIQYKFIHGVRKCFNFILLHLVEQFSQHYLLKRLSFLHCIFLPPLSKIRCA